MAGKLLDLETWPGAPHFRLFSGFERPQYNVTSRVNVTALMTAKDTHGLSPFRTIIWAIGKGLDAVPELRMRFTRDAGGEPIVTLHDHAVMSATIDRPDGSFGFSYFEWQDDRSVFDQKAAAHIAEVRADDGFHPDAAEHQCLAYLSCLPWLDYTSIDNVIPHRDDCTPRVSWGRIVERVGGGHEMAMTLEAHHAFVHGRQVGAFFEAVGDALNSVD
ncbi:MAG: CatA-like O-acetyltransferase [Pseudomonadota bacterium]